MLEILLLKGKLQIVTSRMSLDIGIISLCESQNSLFLLIWHYELE